MNEKRINSIDGDEYEISNVITVCGDCDFCQNQCDFGRTVLSYRIGVGA